MHWIRSPAVCCKTRDRMMMRMTGGGESRVVIEETRGDKRWSGVQTISFIWMVSVAEIKCRSSQSCDRRWEERIQVWRVLTESWCGETSWSERVTGCCNSCRWGGCMILKMLQQLISGVEVLSTECTVCSPATDKWFRLLLVIQMRWGGRRQGWVTRVPSEMMGHEMTRIHSW